MLVGIAIVYRVCTCQSTCSVCAVEQLIFFTPESKAQAGSDV